MKLVMCVMAVIQFIRCDDLVVSEDVYLTDRQQETLKRFIDRVSPILSNPYMKAGVYLTKWLRLTHFDITRAEKILKENLKWRKENGIGESSNEDFSDVAAEYPVFLDGWDKIGSPIITALVGNWDLRKLYLTGQHARLLRYLWTVLDGATKKVFEAREQGKNATRFNILLNFDGFNLVQHSCARCLLDINTLLESFEKYFPGMTNRVVMFNVPDIVLAFGPTIYGALSSHGIGTSIKLIGTNKAEWQKYLLGFIDKDQLNEDYGGTRAEN